MRLPSPVPAILRRASLLVSLSLLFLPASFNAAESGQVVVAIGDVHGNLDGFCDILKRVGLIDDGRHWAGGQTVLIQTGDLVDRGAKERGVLDLMMNLESEAPEVGGQVEFLLGNHEVMNLMGDVRYVTPEIFATFATPDSEALRKSSYTEYVNWRTENATLLTQAHDPQLSLSEQQWLEQHPPGFIEQRAAFSRNGTYGQWIREHHAVKKFDSIVYLHGGVAPEQVRNNVSQLNSRVRSEIHQWDEMFQYLVDRKLILPFFTFQETSAVVKAVLAPGAKLRKAPAQEVKQKLAPFQDLGSWLIVADNGPLWFRGYDEWSDQDGAARIDSVLRAYNASAIVVGHTVQKTLNIRARFGGKVFLIDTGMVASASRAGRASALQIRDNARFSAIYLDSESVLFEQGSAVAPKTH